MERNLAIWDDIDELGHQSGTERQTLPDLLYVKTKRAKLTEAASRMLVARGCGIGEMERYWSKGFQLCRTEKFWSSNIWHSDYS